MTLNNSVKKRLRDIVGEAGFVGGDAARWVYDCDGYTMIRARPELVLLPATADQVRRVVALCHEQSIPFVPRGAGTGLSGGCLPAAIPVMIGTSRMRAIRAIDLPNRRVEVEAGVVNLQVTRAVEAAGYYYPPDPSSQSACTIGGNVAENSGGPHTLKYGVTLNHLLALEWVLPNGDLLVLRRDATEPGYDLAGLCTGSEGTLGIATAATLRLSVRPQAVATLLAVFPSVADASRAVSAMIAAGIVPAALEMMDAAVIAAVEAAYHYGFPPDAGAVLLIEVDGLRAELEDLAEHASRACRAHGATEIRRASTSEEQELLWRSRKKAFGAMGRLAPSYCTQDGVVPRSRLPEIVERIGAIADRFELRIANVMHAGDGNIHPITLYDERDEGECDRVVAAGEEILRACLELGGSLTGEHGIGIEKAMLMEEAFGGEELAAMAAVREAFNPSGLCNPGKLLPTDRGCIETMRPRPRGGG